MPFVIPPPSHKPQPFIPSNSPDKPVEGKPRLAEGFAKRLRIALNTISPASDTSVRNVLDLYYNLLSITPRLVSDGDSNFPRKPVFHAVNRERFTVVVPTKTNLLISVFGAAVLGLYEIADAQWHLSDSESLRALDELSVKVEARVYLIEQIARYGLGKLRVDGTDQTGYTLVKPAVRVSEPAPVNPDRKADDVIGDPDFEDDSLGEPLLEEAYTEEDHRLAERDQYEKQEEG